MTGSGPPGPWQARFEDGLRFLGIALALQEDGRNGGAAVSAACDALRCFLAILDEAGRRRLEDPEGGVQRLGEQARALLDPTQAPAEAGLHAVEAALLARDQAARLLPRLA
ncbi:MAG: hypothetical protein HY823_01185 [Acidobacteria bacterium]|nr:hypothetical protein [Acidobacteriota bacterium]